MINLYVDDINKKYIDILIPFVGIKEIDVNDPSNGRYDIWHKIGKHHIALVDSPTKADFILYNSPFNSEHTIDIHLLNISKTYNKKLLLIYNSDDDSLIDLPNSVILRTSFYDYSKKNNEYAIPAFVDDFYLKCSANDFAKNKNINPVVSFCGYPNSPNRQKIIEMMQNFKKVKCNFIIRNSFWGGAINGFLMKPEAKIVRKEFIENLVQGDYALCVRGGGNFSYRLYESLSLGKIPLFINTNCVLPLDNIIDWKSLCLWVDYKNIDYLEQIIFEYHQNISNEEFIAKQHKCREVWEKYLSPQGYYSNIFSSIGTHIP